MAPVQAGTNIVIPAPETVRKNEIIYLFQMSEPALL